MRTATTATIRFCVTAGARSAAAAPMPQKELDSCEVGGAAGVVVALMLLACGGKTAADMRESGGGVAKAGRKDTAVLWTAYRCGRCVF